MSKVQIINISKNFNQIAALENVNLTFKENKIYGLLGRNGAGKTTLLNVISNRIFPTSGQILINENNIDTMKNQISDIYVVSEKNLFPEGMKVKEIFKWTKEFFPDFNNEKAVQLSKEFHLPRNQKTKSLSTGYLTILKDIVGLCINAKFVFFDEPVLGLDANHRDMFYQHLLKCYMSNNSTFVVSTHLIDEVANLVENVIIIDEGKIIKDTTCEELLSLGYTVSGTIDNVNAFTKGKNVIGEDILGNMKAAYILSNEQLPSNVESIEISKLSLQKLFIELTKKEAEQ